MKRRHPKRHRAGDTYAMLPDEVLRADACRTLDNYSFRVLVALAAQYRGGNNGDLSLTWATAQAYGIRHKAGLPAALRDLEARGLIVRTRQGGRRPVGCSLYALAWRPIDASDKYDSGIQSTLEAPNGWALWSAEKNQRHRPWCRDGTARGADSAPNGTARGADKARLTAPPAVLLLESRQGAQ